MTQSRASFDADVTFLNGGSLTVRDFRLDVASDQLSADEVGLLLVGHLGLLMVGEVSVSGLRFVTEAHKGSRGTLPAAGTAAGTGTGTGTTTGTTTGTGVRLIDLTHPVEEGMVTYPGLPAPAFGLHLSRAESAAHYAPGTEFELATITMIGNTGTYLDAPWHRFPDGIDLAGLPLERTAALDGLLVDVTGSTSRGIDAAALAALDVRGRAVLLRTGWDRHWRTLQYGSDAPFLTGAGAQLLAERGAVLVGIDSLNIDDAGDPHRPAHTGLLAAGIPVLEHLHGLDALPPSGFTLHAAPVPVRRFGTFPVRAYAVLPG
jgi:arylformamidase